MGELNGYITIDEASKILNVDRRHITRMILAGKIRAKNINVSGKERKYWRVLKEDIIKPDFPKK